MNWWQALILGLVQGLTEFLPVSSSGHLVIFRELLGAEAPQDLVFEITVHVATVLATIVVFRKQIIDLLQGLGYVIYKPVAEEDAVDDDFAGSDDEDFGDEDLDDEEIEDEE